MKISKLSLANFRGFKQIDLRFEDDVTVLAGVNGVGKSSILDVLATLLSKALPVFTLSKETPMYLTDEDMHFGQPGLAMSAKLEVGEHELYVDLQRPYPSKDDRRLLDERLESASQRYKATDPRRGKGFEQMISRTIKRRWNDRRDKLNLRLGEVDTASRRTGDLEVADIKSAALLQRMKKSTIQPVAAYYSILRNFNGEGRRIRRRNDDPLSPSTAYRHSLDKLDVDLDNALHWLRLVQEGIYRSKTAAARMVEALNAALAAFLPGFSNLNVASVRNEYLLGTGASRVPVEHTLAVHKHGRYMPVHLLSDGERGVLAIVLDLARRLSIANPELKDPIATGQAVVLIDEIELHLHPKWQREVMRRFTQTFKKCQFVVTSHSPQVLGEVEARCVRFLDHEDGKVTCRTPEHTFGMDSNRILNEQMEVTDRNKRIKSELQRLFKRIDEEKFDQAEDILEELEGKLGEEEPELTRARTLIAFLRGET